MQRIISKPTECLASGHAEWPGRRMLRSPTRVMRISGGSGKKRRPLQQEGEGTKMVRSERGWPKEGQPRRAPKGEEKGAPAPYKTRLMDDVHQGKGGWEHAF